MEYTISTGILTTLELSPATHRNATIQAAKEGMTLEQFIEELVKHEASFTFSIYSDAWGKQESQYLRTTTTPFTSKNASIVAVSEQSIHLTNCPLLVFAEVGLV